MKKIIALASILLITILLLGCSSGGDHGITRGATPSKNEGVVTLPYEKPLDFKCFEVYASTSPDVVPTGWDGSAWTSDPNAPGEWNGTDKTLHTVTANTPIQVNLLKPGVRYYFKIVAVDKSNQRSIPSSEVSEVAGNSQQSATVVIAAADASPASKAGADYVCTGTSDQIIINQAINAAASGGGGKISLTEGTFVINNKIVEQTNVIIEGKGLSTIIQVDNSSGSFDAIVNSDLANGNKGIVLRDFKINFSRTDLQFSNIGIYLVRCHKLFISNVEILNASTGNKIASTDGFTLENVKVHNAWETGINIELCKNGIIKSVFAYENAYSGISIFNSEHISISECQLYKNGGEGLLLNQSSNNSIKNNIIKENNQLDLDNSNLLLTMSCNYNDIQTNTVRAGDLTVKPKYGIRIEETSCENNLISNNDCIGGGTVAGISDAGTGTNFGSGNRTNDGKWRTSMLPAHDTFDINGSLTTDLTGKSWTVIGGTWAKTGGNAYVATASGVTHAYIDAGESNGILNWGVGALANGMRFLFRYSDSSNKWLVNANTLSGVYEIYRQEAGVASVVASIPVTPTAGDKIRVDILDNKIIAYINDTQYVDLTDSFNQTATKHGIYALGTSNARWDSFKMEAV